MTIVDLKNEYRKQLAIVKDENNGATVRKESFVLIQNIYNKIIAEEPKCEIEMPDIIKTRYIDKLDVPKVQWDCKFDIVELDLLEKIRRLAYTWVRVNHPLENDQTDKFGQIVNARMNLILLSRQ